MSLKQKLMDDLKQAMRAGDARRRTTIRLVRAAIVNAEIERGRELGDDGVLEIITREVKRRRESIAEFTRGGRQDLVEQEEAELAILQEYLPPALSEAEIVALARQVIDELGATGPAQMGEVMRRLMPQVKGRADGRMVNQVVKDILISRA